MTFQEFAQTVYNNLQNGYLPGQIPIERVHFGWVEKGKVNSPGLQILLPPEVDGSRLKLLVNLNSLYQEYGHLPVEEACEAATQAIYQQLNQKTVQEIRQMIEDLLHYERVKPYLYVELYPVDPRLKVPKGDILEPIPGVKELTLAPYVDLPGERRARITKQLCKSWEVPENELIREAMTNGAKRYPMECNLYQIKRSGPKETKDISEADMIVITSAAGRGGAASFFYPGVLESFGEKCGSFYFAPVSVRDVIVLPEKRIPERAQRHFDDFVWDIYRNMKQEERLLSHGYRYDAKKRSLETVADFQRRKMFQRDGLEKQQTKKKDGPIL